MALRWTEAAIGLWLLVSPWTLGYSSISVMKWSNVFAGVAIILINVWVIFGERSHEKSQTPNS